MKPAIRRTVLIVACVFAALPASARAGETPTSRPFGGAGMILDRTKEILSQLNLSDEQKAKVDGILDKAKTEWQELRANMDSLQPQERGERIRDFMQTTRQKLADVLTPQQREAMERKFAEERERFRQRNGFAAAPAGATTRPQAGESPRGPNMLGQRLRESLAKLDLSDEQKAKVKGVLDELKSKAEQLRSEAQNGGEEMRDKVVALMEETRGKLKNILTSEQFQKLGEMLGNGREGPRSPQGKEPGRAAPGRGAEQSRMQPDAGDGMMMAEANTKAKSSKPDSKSEISEPKGPAVGETAPELALKKLDGSNLQLSSLKGRIVVLEFGSYSSPSFRTRVAAMEKLKNDLGSRAQFFVVYAREAHATGEWEVDRNKDEGITVEQPKTFDARKTLATSAREKLKITVPMLVDSADNQAAKTLGAGANSAYVIDRDGKIAARQDWFEPAALRRAIEDAANNRPNPTAAEAPAAAPAAPAAPTTRPSLY